MTEKACHDTAVEAGDAAVVKLQMLTIPRSEHGFGFTLRRLPRKGGYLGTAAGLVAFDVAAVKPGSNSEIAGLRPGDGIVSVDGVRVADRTLDQVVKQMQSCKESIRLLVAPEITREKKEDSLLSDEPNEGTVQHTHQSSQVLDRPMMSPMKAPGDLSIEGALQHLSSHSKENATETAMKGDGNQQSVPHSRDSLGPFLNSAAPSTAERYVEQPLSPLRSPVKVSSDCCQQPVSAARQNPQHQNSAKGSLQQKRPNVLFEWPPRSRSPPEHRDDPYASTNAAAAHGVSNSLEHAGLQSIAKPATEATKPLSPRPAGVVREMADVLESLSPSKIACHIAIPESLSSVELSTSSHGAGYQLSAPRLPQRTVRAPVAVADTSGLSPGSTPQGLPPSHSVEASPQAGTAAPPATAGGVRFLPAYQKQVNAVENNYPRATWQKKYGSGSLGRADEEGRPAAGRQAVTGTLMLQHLGRGSRPDDLAARPAAAPLVRGRSGMLNRPPLLPAPDAKAHQTRGRQDVLGRRLDGSFYNSQTRMQPDGSHKTQQSQRAARLGHRSSYKSAPNIGTESIGSDRPANEGVDSVGAQSATSPTHRLGSAKDTFSDRDAKYSSARCETNPSIWPELPPSTSLRSLSRSEDSDGGQQYSNDAPLAGAGQLVGSSVGEPYQPTGRVEDDLDGSAGRISMGTARRLSEAAQVPMFSSQPGLRASLSFGSAMNAMLGPAQLCLQLHGSLEANGDVQSPSRKSSDMAVFLPSEGVSPFSPASAPLSPPLEGTTFDLAPASDDTGRASLPSVSGGSGCGGEDLHSIDSVQSGDSADSSPAPGIPKEDGSSSESLLPVPLYPDSAVILRRKSADVDLRAQLARRTSYMLATSPATDPNVRVAETAPSLVGKDSSTSEGNLASGAQRIHKQKLKHVLTDKVPAIKEGSEKEKPGSDAALALHAPIKEGVLTIKFERIDGKRSVERSWKPFTVELSRHRMYMFRDKKEYSTSSLSMINTVVEEATIDIRTCKVELALGYTKKKNSFRVETLSGTELLLHASDIADMMAWIRAILTAALSAELSEDPAKVSSAVSSTIRSLEQQLANASRSNALATAVGRTPSARKLGGNFWSRSNAGGASSQPDHGFPSPLKKDRKGAPHPGTRSPEDEGDGKSGSEQARAFGIPLSECSPSHENEFVPLVVEQCTKAIEERGLEFTGLYRVPGNAAAVKTLRGELNRGIVDLENERWRDVNVVGSLLKQFFRKLPEPLVTAELYREFVNANHLPTHEERLRRVKHLVHCLPECNFETLRYLIRHLCKVASFGHINKMEPRNLAICFGPTVVGCDNHTTLDTAMDMSDQCQIIESVILYSDWVFAAPVPNEAVPAIRDDASTATTPISETMQNLGDDLAKIAASNASRDKSVLASVASAAANRKNTKDDWSKTRPSVSSEHSDGGFSERDIDAEVAAKQAAHAIGSVGENGSRDAATCTIPEKMSLLTVEVSSVETASNGASTAVVPHRSHILRSGDITDERSRQPQLPSGVPVPYLDSPSSEVPPIPARRHAVFIDGACNGEQPTICNSEAANAGGAAALVIDLPGPRPPRPPRLRGIRADSPSGKQLSALSPASLDASSSSGDFPLYGNIDIPPRAMAVGAVLDASDVGLGKGGENSQSLMNKESPAASESIFKELHGRSVSLDSLLDLYPGGPAQRLSASLSSMDEASDLMLAITAKFDDELKLVRPTGPPACQHKEALDDEASTKRWSAEESCSPGDKQGGACVARLREDQQASSGVISRQSQRGAVAPAGSACYRDPTLHKAANAALSSAGNPPLGAAHLPKRMLKNVSKRHPAGERLQGPQADAGASSDCDSNSTSGEIIHDAGGCKDDSVSKRKMTDERKRLRRRHTLGGGDHFEQFKEVSPRAAAQNQIPKVSWELLQLPLLRHVELTALSAFGWS